MGLTAAQTSGSDTSGSGTSGSGSGSGSVSGSGSSGLALPALLFRNLLRDPRRRPGRTREEACLGVVGAESRDRVAQALGSHDLGVAAAKVAAQRAHKSQANHQRPWKYGRIDAGDCLFGVLPQKLAKQLAKLRFFRSFWVFKVFR